MAYQKPKMVMVVTVAETYQSILKEHPKWLSEYFDLTLVSSDGDEFDDIEAREGIRPVALEMTRTISPIKDLVSIWNFAKLLRKINPDLVQSYTPKAGLVGMLGAFLARVPLRVHTFTGLIFPTETGLKKRILTVADWIIAAASTAAVPEGQGVRNDLKNAGISIHLQDVIGNGNIVGLDLNAFDPDNQDIIDEGRNLRAKFGIADDTFLYGFLGRINIDKGVKELVDAFLAQDDETAELIFFGGLDLTAPPDQATLKRMETHPRIHLAGFTTNVAPAYAMMDCFILPSYREGFPNSVIQGCAMGIPTIVTDVNGSNEIIKDGENGLIIPPRATEPLTKALNEVRKMDPEARTAMGKKAREGVIKSYTRQEVRRNLLAFYEAKLGRKVY